MTKEELLEEVDQERKWLDVAGYTAYNVDIVFHSICQNIKALEPKTGHWIYNKSIDNWQCSECGETPKTMGYVGDADFMRKHFKFCNHCGTRMEREGE